MLTKRSINLGTIVSLIDIIKSSHDLINKFIFLPELAKPVTISPVNKQPLYKKEITMRLRKPTFSTPTIHNLNSTYCSRPPPHWVVY